MTHRRVEVVIVGGGPAGLSAALLLGRCRRDVVVFDDGQYRNAAARQMHGFLTRERSSPHEMRQVAHREIEQYPSVAIVAKRIEEVRRLEREFAVVASDGEELRCPALLLATGFRDALPDVAGARELEGELVVPCPYCDAWEVRDQPIAAFSHADDSGARFAALLAQWSRDLVFCSDRRPVLGETMRRTLERRAVRVEPRPLRSVERDGDGLRLSFADGPSLWRRMLFYHLGGGPAARLAEHLGARLDAKGGVDTNRRGESSVPGLFAAGDATRDVLQAIVAAGEGAAAAVTINEYICHEELYAKPST